MAGLLRRETGDADRGYLVGPYLASTSGTWGAARRDVVGGNIPMKCLGSSQLGLK